MTLEDERAITAVLLRYATAIDRRDWALFHSCFAADLEADYPGFGHWHDAEAITAFMAQAHAALGPTLHRLSNIVIEGEGDEAIAQSYVDALLMPGEADGQVHQAAGRYEDRLVRTAAGWKISRRRFIAVRLS